MVSAAWTATEVSDTPASSRLLAKKRILTAMNPPPCSALRKTGMLERSGITACARRAPCMQPFGPFYILEACAAVEVGSRLPINRSISFFSEGRG